MIPELTSILPASNISVNIVLDFAETMLKLFVRGIDRLHMVTH